MNIETNQSQDIFKYEMIYTGGIQNDLTIQGNYISHVKNDKTEIVGLNKDLNINKNLDITTEYDYNNIMKQYNLNIEGNYNITVSNNLNKEYEQYTLDVLGNNYQNINNHILQISVVIVLY